MMTIGDKIRGMRLLKGLSQENMAAMMDMPLLAYGEIERGKDIKLSRLNQIAEKLNVPSAEIVRFGETVSNFFDQCNGVVGLNNGQQINHYDIKGIEHQLEKLQLELKNNILQISSFQSVHILLLEYRRKSNFGHHTLSRYG
jgi:transcriptional regulator with XRE-family HTH domain